MVKRRFRSRGKFRRIRRRRGVRSRRLFRTIKRTLNRITEIKYSTANNVINIDPNVGFIAYLPPVIAQGVDKNQRIGNRIKYKKLSFRFIINVQTVAAIDYTPIMVRYIVFQPRTQLSNPIVLADFLDVPTDPLSTIKGTAVRVMYDKMSSLVPTNDANQIGSGPQKHVRKITFMTKNNVTYRDSTVSLPTDVKDTYYFVVLTQVLGQGAGGYLLIGQWFVRQSFIDI